MEYASADGNDTSVWNTKNRSADGHRDGKHERGLRTTQQEVRVTVSRPNNDNCRHMGQSDGRTRQGPNLPKGKPIARLEWGLIT